MVINEVKAEVSTFRFHIGSIKSIIAPVNESAAQLLFRFQIGAIKSNTTYGKVQKILRFRFHTGAIKSSTCD